MIFSSIYVLKLCIPSMKPRLLTLPQMPSYQVCLEYPQDFHSPSIIIHWLTESVSFLCSTYRHRCIFVCSNWVLLLPFCLLLLVSRNCWYVQQDSLDTSLGFVRQAYLHAHLKLGLEQPTLIIVSIILLVERQCQQEMFCF